MKAELRTIKATVMAGYTDVAIGLALYFLGWIDWYYQHFHFFGVMGIAMLVYGYWHIYLYRKETGKRVIKWKEIL